VCYQEYDIVIDPKIWIGWEMKMNVSSQYHVPSRLKRMTALKMMTWAMVKLDKMEGIYLGVAGEYKKISNDLYIPFVFI
jgi:hypothetical protein